MSALKEQKQTRKKFTANENLIQLVIERQAGTVAKSALEAVMNSIDAGASRIDLDVSMTGMRIVDNGRGFRTEDEVESWFGEFGNPHQLDGEGYSTDARYGTFRSGRGQLFAFGKNIWRTNHFEMVTDIRNEGLGYDLTHHSESYPGCDVRVLFYEPLSASDLQSLERDAELFCKYVDTDLYLNGRQINKPPSSQTWDDEDDLAWVKLSSGVTGVAVYQLGVFVETIPSHVYGVSGTVVTKQQVKLNFARNQVIRTCSRWKRITKMLSDKSKDIIKVKTTLDASERQSVIQSILTGDADKMNVARLKIFPDVRGQYWSMNQINLQLGNGKQVKFDRTPLGELRYSFSRRGCAIGDKVMQAGTGIVFDKVLLEQFGSVAEPEKFFQNIRHVCTSSFYSVASSINHKTVYCDLNSMFGSKNTEARTLDKTKWTSKESDVVSVVGGSIGWMSGYRYKRRRVVIGDSDAYDGWTDGSSYIAISRQFMSRISLSKIEDWYKLCRLVVHELCHDEATDNTHVHGIEFYEAFHDKSYMIGNYTMHCIRNYLSMLKKRNSKIPKALMSRIMMEQETEITEIINNARIKNE